MLFAFSAPGSGSAEPPARPPLDALWHEHMLAGSAATIYVDESGQRTVSIPRRPFDEQRAELQSVESAAGTTYGIQVARLDERFLLWRNGGWVLQGGLLARATEQSSTIELYGKAAIRQPPYVPGGSFPRDAPRTTAYEFFLLLRKAGVPRATILREWVVQPDDVAKDGWVRAALQYNTAKRTATVTITGLKNSFADTFDLLVCSPVELDTDGAILLRLGANRCAKGSRMVNDER